MQVLKNAGAALGFLFGILLLIGLYHLVNWISKRMDDSSD
jgi:hypothetical protein